MGERWKQIRNEMMAVFSYPEDDQTGVRSYAMLLDEACKRIAELEAERDNAAERLAWHEQGWTKLTADLRAVGVTLFPNSQGDDDFAGQIVRAVEDRNETIAELRDGNRQREDYWRARVAALEAERRWVPVGERLPSEGEHAVGLFRHGRMHALSWQAGEWCGSHSEPLVLIEPTHWMPLPKPPEATDAD